MVILISRLSFPLDHSIDDVLERAVKETGVHKENIAEIGISKRSVDARRADIRIVYAVRINLVNKQRIRVNENIRIIEHKQSSPEYGKALLRSRPIVIGFGPTGLFCSYLLAKHGYRPIVLERGQPVDKRQESVDAFFSGRPLSVRSNIQFGEGGAGTFSDGKLTTRINDNKCEYVLKLLHRFGAGADILYEAHPHLGTDRLKNIVKNMREEIIKLGGEVHFESRVDNILVNNGVITGVTIDDNREFECETAVLAIGHSARDTYHMLYNMGISMEKKPFSVGVRIEHLQDFIDERQYGGAKGHKNLGRAEYRLSYRNKERGCYSFCMCPGGLVVAAASEENSVVTNGMSFYERGEINANSAIAASVLPSDLDSHILSGMEFQRMLEIKAFNAGGCNYSAPCQLTSDFLLGTKSTRFSGVYPSYPRGTEFANFWDIFPGYISDMLAEGLNHFDKIIKGFAGEGSLLTGVETRTSAPIRILRGADFQSITIKGLYPAGEGSGYAGGIMSAAVDGLKSAEAIIGKYKPF